MTQTLNPTPGSIVSCRSRQWVVLPAENEEIIRLRPLSGNEEEIAGIYNKLRELGLALFHHSERRKIEDNF